MSHAEPKPSRTALPRSPELMSRDDTALLVVDVQERLLPLIPDRARLVWNVGRLIDGADLLGLPKLATVQYPQGLGAMVPPLAQRLGNIAEKRAFSCGGCPELFSTLQEQGRHKLAVCGMETHVCIAQTVLDLLAAGFRVYVPVDAVAARHALDHETALARLAACGATLTSTEAALFEWCQTSAASEFKAISQLVRQAPLEQ